MRRIETDMKRISPGRDSSRPCMLVVMLLWICSSAFAGSIDSVVSKLTALHVQMNATLKQCDQEKKINRDLVSRASQSDEAMKKAYASAERWNVLNAKLNQLQEEQSSLCEEWRAAYAQTVDALLIQAGREKDPKKKGEIGQKLQALQKQNLELCPDHRKSTISQEWRSVRVENYDGPQEVHQKIQLLQGISREINIHLTQLDQQLQNFQKEKQTRERAEEFVQESTLFTDSVAIRRTGRNVDTTASGPVTGETSTGVTEVFSRSESYGKEQQEQFELQYHQKKADLLTQQKDLRQKLTELEKRAQQLEIP